MALGWEALAKRRLQSCDYGAPLTPSPPLSSPPKWIPNVALGWCCCESGCCADSRDWILETSRARRPPPRAPASDWAEEHLAAPLLSPSG